MGKLTAVNRRGNRSRGGRQNGRLIHAKRSKSARAMNLCPETETWQRDTGACTYARSGPAFAFAIGVLYKVAQGAGAAQCVHTGVFCATLVVLFSSLREVVWAVLGVGRHSASALAFGFCGALFAGPCLKTVSQGVTVIGICCGLAERWFSNQGIVDTNVCDARWFGDTEIAGETVRSEFLERGVIASYPRSWFNRTTWRLAERGIGKEYEELIGLRETTILALAEEQAHIAILVEKLGRRKGQPNSIGRLEKIITNTGWS